MGGIIMTREDKELLLKDLCSRLPYGVKIEVVENNDFSSIEELDCYYLNRVGNNFYSIKPYLFPLSTMTEEQKKEYNHWKHEVPVCHYEYGDVVEEVELLDSPASFEYLIENHFDYYGLIEKGLAIDATNKNIY